jgi:succinate dehydrogenase/fumarate reductase flavoprotein subunit
MLPTLYVTKTKRFNLEWIEALEVRNMLDASEMAIRSAFMRTESRGLHERAEYPEARTEWLKHIILCKSGDKMQLSTEPVIFSYEKPAYPSNNLF